LREENQIYEGLFDEWLKLWQIRKEQANQAIDGETELEVSNKGPPGYQLVLHSCDVTPVFPNRMRHVIRKKRSRLIRRKRPVKKKWINAKA
jgi:hypothetical protein